MKGTTFPPVTYEVERGQIRALARVLGETNPVYHDVAAARAAGYPDLPAPPTLPTCFGLWPNEAVLARLEELGAPYLRMLHGEEEYEYLAPFFAGDTLIATMLIADVQQRQARSGPLDLITLQTTFTNQHGAEVCVQRLVVVVRREA